MAVPFHIARKYVGRAVVAHCIDGRKYYGIVTHVTPDTIHLRPLPQYCSSQNSLHEDNITNADYKSTTTDVECIETQFGYGFGYPGFGYPGFGYPYGAGIVLPLYVLLVLSLLW